ncbi:MAG: hypothetical protein HY846_07995 [Nitrosomonadales bacterium]|nr:hypothetical protein [Nitrosomonadales bacterium]
MSTVTSHASDQNSTNDFFFFKPRNSINPVRSTLNARRLKVIIDAMHVCWGEIKTFPYMKSHKFQSKDLLDEDELSTKLVEILNYKLQRDDIKGFKANAFQDVIRDGKQSTAKTDSYDQMPDMTFRMIKYGDNEDRSESGLFVECKLVSKTNGCGEYVAEGMFRFVSGRYAPQMGYGLMLGYATENFSNPVAELQSYFAKATKTESVQCNATLNPTKLHSSCYASIHKRPTPCTPEFYALHIWLVRPNVS